MRLEDFQFIHDTSNDSSIIKRDYMKIYQQQRDQLSKSSKRIDFKFGENNNYHQLGYADPKFDVTLTKDGNNSSNLGGQSNICEPFRMVNSSFAYFAYEFSIATLSTTGGEDNEVNKYCGYVSTITRLITSKDGDILSSFDIIDKSQSGIPGSSLNEIFIIPDKQAADRGKVNGHLP